MFFKGQPKLSVETNSRRSVKSSERTGTYVFPALLGLLLLLCVAPGALAQGLSGSTLRGVVKDATGGLLPNASVKLISARGGERQVKTNDEGAYVFTSVEPGLYTLRVEVAGFKVHQQTEFTLSPSDTRNLDVALEVGAPTETVTVTADAVPIKTDTGERSDTITAKQLDNLSIIGRSSLELLRILPGVVAPDPNDLEFNTFGGGSNANQAYTVNGIRGVNNNVSIDGSRVIDIGSNNGTIITANNDMVQEVTVKTSNYAAEYGSSSVQVFATTKGGGKDFHGEGYDYLRPKRLQASDRSNTIAGAKQPNTSFSYPGGNIGGPVLFPFTNFNRNRDKLFFFVGLEFQRQIRDPGTKLGTVPTQAERNGDFSKSLTARSQLVNGVNTPVFCPATTAWNAACATPVPGGNFSSLKSPLGVALLNLFPLPNFTGTGGNANRNYSSAITAPANRSDFKARIDYKVSDNTNVYLRLARESESDDAPYGIWWGPSTFELPSHLVGTNLGRSVAANITSVLSPTMTNELVVSASKLQLHYDYSDPSKVSKSALGLQNLNLPWGSRATTPYAPLALISWDVNSHLWEPGGIPLFAFNDSESVSETLSKVTGNHTVKFGGLIEKAGKFQNLNGLPEGQIEYESGGGVFTSGNAFANLYSGVINGIDQTTNVPNGRFKFWNFEGYAQDSWKFRPNITVELGARMSYYTNNAEQTGLGVAFSTTAYKRGAGAFLTNPTTGLPDPSKPNGILTEASGQLPKGIFAKNPPMMFAPRLNVAWDLFKDGSTVLRGGAGVFYNRVQGNYQYGVLTAPPNLLTLHADSWGNGQVPITLDNLAQYNPLTNPGTLVRPNIYTQDPNPDSNIIPRIMTTSVSVARRLPFQNVLEVAYVGTFGRHLPQSFGFNFVFPNTTGTLGNANLANPLHRAALAANGSYLNALLPFPDWGTVKYNEFIGTSNYHSMQVTLNRQLGKSLQYFVTYTFSKALGTAAVNESDGDASIDPLNGHNSYGILSYDRTHIFNLSYNYNLPKIARGSFDNWFTRGVLNGWQMSGITTFQSGRPIRVRFGGAAQSASALFAYFGHTVTAGGNTGQASGVAPVFSRNPVTGNTKLNETYLDISAISVPAFGTNGPSQSPFYMRAPTTNNWDVTFFKNFNISETKKFQFRAGFFDVFNQAYPNPDQLDLGNLTINTLNVTNPATGQCFYLAAGTPNGNGTVAADSVCDPTKGYRIDPASAANFGKVVNKHGHRRVELAFKFYF